MGFAAYHYLQRAFWVRSGQFQGLWLRDPSAHAAQPCGHSGPKASGTTTDHSGYSANGVAEGSAGANSARPITGRDSVRMEEENLKRLCKSSPAMHGAQGIASERSWWAIRIDPHRFWGFRGPEVRHQRSHYDWILWHRNGPSAQIRVILVVNSNQ